MYNKPYFGQVPDLIDLYMETFGYITDGYFVDIGAFDCYQWSNTYTLAEVGWRGLMVEPQPEYAVVCRELLSELPNVTIVEAAVSDFTGEAMLHLGGSVSSIDTDQVDRYIELGWPFFGENQFTEVNVIHARELFEEYQVPKRFEVLSLDAEGSEFAILEAMDISVYRPVLAIVETHEKLEGHSEYASKIDTLFNSAGYKKIYSDHINSIYHVT